MALTDVVAAMRTYSLARGDSGSLVDAVAPRKSVRVFLSVPVAADVKSGVQYGQQGTELTGSYVGGGGSVVHPIVGGGMVRAS